MKSVVILIVALAIAAGAWWFTTGQGDKGISVSGDTTELSVEEQDTTTIVLDEEAAGEESSEPADAADTDTETAASDDAAGTDTESADSSPFAVVGTDEVQEAASAVAEELTPQVELPDTDQIADDAVDATQRAVQRIEVPTSYPVTDAAKYFVPKEERGPGNLGGPPPLNFPGGPSDPNRDSATPFQPPAAPGQ